ncbi:MAG: (5-formylfuran-3-yl)methyl phosphate synthase [Promethearchaeota archaeon]
MKILASIKSINEIEEAVRGGADIIDLKNPEEGSLGAAAPWDIKTLKDQYNDQIISAAIGDFPNLPNTAALAALGAAVSGSDYVKIGLHGVENAADALKVMKSVVKAVKSYNPEIFVVGAGFADYQKINSINPLDLPEILHEAKADIVMIDTAIKDGNSLFSYFDTSALRKFVESAHSCGLQAALAGSLLLNHIPILKEIETDVIGFRTAICDNGNRVSGVLSAEKVREIMKIVNS